MLHWYLKSAGKNQKELLASRLVDLQSKQEKHISETQPIIDGFDGLMARIGALGELPWLPSFFIFLLFLAIETSPIFSKLMSRQGEYDIKLGERENEILVWSKQKHKQRMSLLLADSALNDKVYDSIQSEEETYHYKKQQARALIRYQSDAFLEKQKTVVDIS